MQKSSAKVNIGSGADMATQAREMAHILHKLDKIAQKVNANDKDRLMTSEGGDDTISEYNAHASGQNFASDGP